jgi:hypothetical protein
LVRVIDRWRIALAGILLEFISFCLDELGRQAGRVASGAYFASAGGPDESEQGRKLQTIS